MVGRPHGPGQEAQMKVAQGSAGMGGQASLTGEPRSCGADIDELDAEDLVLVLHPEGSHRTENAGHGNA